MNLFELSAKLSLDSSAFQSGIAHAKSAVSTFGKVAAVTFAAGTAAFTAFAKDAVSTGMAFDSAMSQVAATMGVTTDEIKELRDFAKEMGATTRYSAVESAQALNYMALAGYDADKAMATLPTVMRLASAGGMDLARASDMVTDAESALGLTSKETANMVNQMAMAASKSNTSVEQLGDAMLTIGGTAKFMSGGTDRLQTVLGLLADNGIKGTEAGTHLRNMLLKLSSPTENGAKIMQELGVSVFDAEGNMRDMQDIMLDLGGALENLTEEQRVKALSELFNSRDLAAVNALLGTSKKRWDELGSAIANAKGSAEKMSETQLDNLNGQITIMKSALEGVKIEFAEGITPALQNIVKNVTEWLSSPKTMAFIHNVGEKAGELVRNIFEWVNRVIPYITKFVESLAPVFKGVFGGIKGVVSDLAKKGFGLLVGSLDKINGILPKLGDWFKKITDFLKKLWPSVRDVAKVLINIGRTALPIVVNLIKKLAPIIKTVFDVISKIAKAVGPLLEKVLNLIGDVLNDVVGDLSIAVKFLYPLVNLIKNLASALKPVLDILSAINSVVNTLLGPVRKVFSAVGDFLGITADEAEDAADAFEDLQVAIDYSDTDFSTLSETLRNNIDAANSAAEAYRTLGQELGDSWQESESEISHIQTLKSELDKLVDSEGRVNDENLERAKFISEELENLTGQEIEFNGNVITSYEEIGKAIDDLVEKKRAAKLMELAENRADLARQNLDVYANGIYAQEQDIAGYYKTIESLYDEYYKANRSTIDELEVLQKQREQYYQDLEGNWHDMYNNDAVVTQEFIDSLDSKIEAVDAKLEPARTDTENKVARVRDQIAAAEEKVLEYKNLEMLAWRDITEYENAYILNAEGNYAAVQDMLKDSILSQWQYVVASRKLTDEELQNLKDEYNTRLETYERYKDAYARGDKNMTQEMVEEARRRAEAVGEEYRKATAHESKQLKDAAKVLGIDFASGFDAGLAALVDHIKGTVRRLGKEAVGEMKRTLEISSPSKVTREIGQYFGEGFSEGILDEVKPVERAVSDLSDSAVDAFGNPVGGKSSPGQGQSRIEYFLQQILENLGFDVVLDDGTLVGRIDKLLGQTAMRKARGNG